MNYNLLSLLSRREDIGSGEYKVARCNNQQAGTHHIGIERTISNEVIMNFIKLKIILIFVFGLFLTIQVNAQLCGKYSMTLNILSENDQKVENVFVQLIPLGKDETRGKTFKQSEEDASKFFITFLEGHQLHNKYKAIISAQQIETYEMELKFPHCKSQEFDVRLKALAKDTVTLRGSIYDANGALIPQVKITATNKEGRIIESVTDNEGKYSLRLPVNKYDDKDIRDFEIAKYNLIIDGTNSGLNKVSFDNFGISPSLSGMYVDFALDTFVNINKIKIEYVIIKGKVADKNGAFVPNLLIKFINQNGKTFQTASKENGSYSIKLPIGKYQIVAEDSSSKECIFINKQKEITVLKSSTKIYNITMIFKYNNFEDCVVY